MTLFVTNIIKNIIKITNVGLARSPTLPCPNLPLALLPQENMTPLLDNAKQWLVPHANLTILFCGIILSIDALNEIVLFLSSFLI